MVVTKVENSSIQLSSAVNVRKIWGDIIYNVKAYGAKGDWNGTTGTDDTAAIQKAVDAALVKGGIIYFPPGKYLTSSGIVVNQTSNTAANDQTRVTIMGAGSSITTIKYSGTGTALQALGGTSGEGNHSYETIQGLSIEGFGQTTAIGLQLQGLAFIQLIDLRITGLGLALSMQDVETSRFESLIMRFNQRGIYASKTTGTMPNAFTFVSCQVANNVEYGGYFVGGSCINWLGGSVEGNGVVGTSGLNHGLRFEDCGYEGGVGCILTGVYFEGNGGDASLVIHNTVTPTATLNSCTYVVNGCSFNRTSPTDADHNILCHFTANAGKQMLVVEGSGFKGYNTYVPDETRKYIYFSGRPMSNETITLVGNVFEEDIETIYTQVTPENVIPDGNAQLSRWKDTTLTSSPTYGKAEQYLAYAGGTISAGTITHDPAVGFGISGTAVKVSGVTLTGSGTVSVLTRLEANIARTFKDKFVTFSCRAFHDVGSAISCVLTIREAVSNNVFSTTDLIVSGPENSVFSSVDTRISLNDVYVGDCSNGLELQITFLSGAVTNKNFWVTDFQIDFGAIATDVKKMPYGQALVNAQRYLFSTFPEGYPPAQNSGTANGALAYIANTSGSSGRGSVQVYFPVPMVKAPIVTFYNPTVANANWVNTTAGTSSGSGAAALASNNGFLAYNEQVVGDSAQQVIAVHLTADARL